MCCIQEKGKWKTGNARAKTGNSDRFREERTENKRKRNTTHLLDLRPVLGQLVLVRHDGCSRVVLQAIVVVVVVVAAPTVSKSYVLYVYPQTLSLLFLKQHPQVVSRCASPAQLTVVERRHAV